jgi:Fe-S-cluster-containing dehydrogenase component
MRYAEVETEERGLEWLIRKDGCMHCEDPGCLKACPAPGAIIKYANGIVDFHQENCIGCGYCVTGCPSTSRASRRRTARPTSARCAPTASRSVWSRPASRPARPAASASAPRRT